MSYNIGQEIWSGGEDKNSLFLAPADGTFIASRISSLVDMGIDLLAEGDDDNFGYMDECLYYTGSNNFKANTTYYFHGRIMRLPSDQVFNVQLRTMQSDEADEASSITQYIKKITVKKRNTEYYNDWVDVHFLFTPIIDNFDCLTFTLSRSAAAGDFTPATVRFPAIIYEELSVVGNYMTSLGHKSFTKIGVQSHPGLELSVNGEDITVGRSGIYEVRNDLISVNSFSVITAAEETNSTGKDFPYSQNYPYIDEKTWESIKAPEGLDKAQYDLALHYWAWNIPWRIAQIDATDYSDNPNQAVVDKQNVYATTRAVIDKDAPETVEIPDAWKSLGKKGNSPTSDCRVGVSKVRKVDPFILDYMYES